MGVEIRVEAGMMGTCIIMFNGTTLTVSVPFTYEVKGWASDRLIHIRTSASHIFFSIIENCEGCLIYLISQMESIFNLCSAPQVSKISVLNSINIHSEPTLIGDEKIIALALLKPIGLQCIQ